MKNEAILAAAQAMAEAAEKEQERFVEHGLSADFMRTSCSVAKCQAGEGSPCRERD